MVKDFPLVLIRVLYLSTQFELYSSNSLFGVAKLDEETLVWPHRAAPPLGQWDSEIKLLKHGTIDKHSLATDVDEPKTELSQVDVEQAAAPVTAL